MHGFYYIFNTYNKNGVHKNPDLDPDPEDWNLSYSGRF
jgi:hypothetical protein